MLGEEEACAGIRDAGIAGTAAQGAAPASGSSPPAVSSSVGAIQDELSDLGRARSSRCVEERSGNTWARWPCRVAGAGRATTGAARLRLPPSPAAASVSRVAVWRPRRAAVRRTRSGVTPAATCQNHQALGWEKDRRHADRCCYRSPQGPGREDMDRKKERSWSLSESLQLPICILVQPRPFIFSPNMYNMLPQVACMYSVFTTVEYSLNQLCTHMHASFPR